MKTVKTNKAAKSVSKEIDKPLYIASYFGFTPIDCPRVDSNDFNLAEDCLRFDKTLRFLPERLSIMEKESKRKTPFLHDGAEKLAFLRRYNDELLNLPHPISVSYKRNEWSRNCPDYHFHIVGSASAMAEAILIRTAMSVLEEDGYKRLSVEINSVGDKDSLMNYEKELHNFLKKVQTDICQEHRDLLKEDIFELLSLELPEGLEARMPLSIASLSSPSRAHFKEIWECLEHLGVDFRLSHRLFGNKHYASHAIFTIRNQDDDKVLAAGSRYSRLSKRLGFKKEVPASSVTIFGEPKRTSKTPIKKYKDLPKPKFYLVQLGETAKMKSLPIIELLRVNRIPVYHFLGKDKITSQLSMAESLRVPYLLIIGHKEALDNTVTVRNMSTRAQATVSSLLLPDYLKHIAL